ncbi:hypothetical protein Kfla_4643 [Kribbella flavida DSM 17836]|uniref:ScoMcrA-like SRA domain-containing protein n=1 Tax=Kribbella flavida (strain DSM 17836 / JCM 10339 / NBRC 14399) TaxID=479435 RepID=D2PY55_KRIFD|nr:hypothetical protein [Kribbella flavida]ADB33661.1 hypothetical protein Kfla_4643 [Kribbella flavida DSM 17836]
MGTDLTEWPLQVGDVLSRSERSRRFGGALFGGIEPSAKSPNVFLYSDPSAAEKYGYNYDGWVDGVPLYLYTGDGQVGDQQFRDGNRAIRHHRVQGRALRLFVTDGKVPGTAQKIQRYVGEFALDPELPYVRAEALDVEKVMRSVIVFRLRPVGAVLRRSEDSSKFGDVSGASEVVQQPLTSARPDLSVDGVALEVVSSTEYAFGAQVAGVASKREALLVERFERYLNGRGHRVGRFRVRPPGELRTLHTDVVDFSENVLYEAKATATREAIRMAIGQLLDYSRHLPKKHALAVLLPSPPSDDLVALLRSLNIRCVCEVDTGFIDVD